MQDYIRAIMHEEYAKIARKYFDNASSCLEELTPLAEKLATLTGDDADSFEFEFVSPIEHEMLSHCLITVVFCALAVEGYIYDYAARNLGDSFVESHLDKLDVISKWVVIPKLITGKGFPKDSRGFQLLRQLVTNRNFIAHSKSAPVLVFDERVDGFVSSSAARKIQEFNSTLLEKAKDAITALDELALIMEDLDPNEFVSIHFCAPVGKNKKALEEYGA